MAYKEIRINIRPADFWICSILVLYNFFLKYPYITARDLSWDEPFSVFYSQFDIPRIIKELFQGNNPPLWELILHITTKFTGISESAVRMPSLIFSCFTPVFIYLTGKKLRGVWLGVFGALMFSSNSMQFFYSLAARCYALLGMLTAATIYVSVLLYQEPWKLKYRIWLAALNAMLFYTHYLSVFIIGAQVIAWLFTIGHKPFFKNVFQVFIADLILVIPALIVFAGRATNYSSSSVFNPPDQSVFKQSFYYLFKDARVYNGLILIISVGLVLFFARAFIRKGMLLQNIYPGILLFFMFALPVGITWYYSHTYPFYCERYYLFAGIPLYLFAGYFISSLFRPFGRIWAFLIFIYFINLSYDGMSKMPSDYLLREWKEATLKAKSMQENNPQSIVFIYPLWADLGFSYYYNRSLYNDPYNYNAKLGEKNAYRLWNTDSVEKILDKNAGKTIVYYCDESTKPDSINDGNVRAMMRRNYLKDTSFFYQQCTNVMLFKPAVK
jgi:hypothetical protein